MLFNKTKASKYKKNAGSISLIVILIVAAIVVIGGIAFVATGAASKFVHSTFDSPKKYFSYVVKEDLMGKGSSSIASVAEKYSKNVLNTDMAMEEEITITIGERGDKYLSMLKSEGLNLSWFEKAGLKYSINSKDDVMEINTSLSLNEKTIISPNLIFDTKKNDLYFQIPEASKNYGKVNLDDYSEMFEEVMARYEKMMEAYPDSKELKKLASKYLDIVLDQLDNIEKEKGASLTVKGVTQKCTLLKVKIKPAQIEKIVKAVCKELAKDKDVEKLLKEYLDSMYGDYDWIDVDEVLDNAMENIGEVADEFDAEDLGIDNITVELYLDGNGSIIGRVLKIQSTYDDEITVKLACATSKKEVGFEASVEYDDTKAGIEGTGKLKGSKLTGDYFFKLNGVKLVKLAVEDFDVSAFEKGNLKGHFNVSFDDEVEDLMDSDLIYELPYEARYALRSLGGAVANYGLDLIVDIQEKKHSVDIGIQDDGDDIVRIAFKGKTKGASKVKIPTKDVSKLEDDSEFEEFISDMSWDKIKDALEDAGVSSKLMEEIGLDGLFGGSSYLENSRKAKDQQIISGWNSAAVSSYTAEASSLDSRETYVIYIYDDELDIEPYNAKGITQLTNSFQELSGISSNGYDFRSNMSSKAGKDIDYVKITIDGDSGRVVTQIYNKSDKYYFETIMNK